MGLRAETPCCLCFLWDEFDARIVRGSPFTIHQSLCSLCRFVDTWVSFAENILRSLPNEISLLLCRLAFVHEIVEGCSFRGIRIYLVAIAVDRDSWLADRRKRKRHYRSLCPLFHPGAPVQFCRAYLHKVALSTAGFEKFLLSPLFEMNFY